MPKSCYASPKLEAGRKCPNHDTPRPLGEYCKYGLTGKVVNPETCGKSYEWIRPEKCPITGKPCEHQKCSQTRCPYEK